MAGAGVSAAGSLACSVLFDDDQRALTCLSLSAVGAGFRWAASLVAFVRAFRASGWRHLAPGILSCLARAPLCWRSCLCSHVFFFFFFFFFFSFVSGLAARRACSSYSLDRAARCAIFRSRSLALTLDLVGDVLCASGALARISLGARGARLYLDLLDMRNVIFRWWRKYAPGGWP